MNMFEKDKYVKSHALSMWANYIETGDVCLSTCDAINSDRRDSIKALSLEQQEFVVRLRKLANKELE